MGRSAPSMSDAEYEAFVGDVSDGCGCVEMWEYMSRRRRDGDASTPVASEG